MKITVDELNYLKWENRELRDLVLDFMDMANAPYLRDDEWDQRLLGLARTASEMLEGSHRETRKIPAGAGQ